MSATDGDASSEDALYDTVGLYVVPQLLYVAAKLGIADLLRERSLDAAALARRTGAHAPALARALDALASLGIFARGRGGRYRFTAAAEPLLTDHPRSRRAQIVFAGEEQHRAWGEIMHSITSGRAAFDRAYGRSFGEHLERDRDAMARAERVRGRRNALRNDAILAALDLGRARTVVDVGGGTGDLLGAILTRSPTLRGVLFERPKVAERARARLRELGVADRCEIVTGDARRRVPAGHDLYLLAEVIHCFEDRDAQKILSNCRGARVCIVDRVLEPGARSVDLFADLHTLVMFGGRERSRRELSALLAASSLRLRRITRTTSWVSIADAVPA
jgi:hypothetical protein